MAAIDYLEARNKTFTKKTKEPLASMLDDAFTFNSPRHGTKDSKKDHLKMVCF